MTENRSRQKLMSKRQYSFAVSEIINRYGYITAYYKNDFT